MTLAALCLAAAVGTGAFPHATPGYRAASGDVTLQTTVTPALRPAASAVKIWVAKPHFARYPANTAYPWARDQTQALDTFGMVKRQCVSFAAWYVNVHGTPFGYMTRGPKGVGTFDNATVWDSAARKAGFVVSSQPITGAIAQWHAHEKSSWRLPNGSGMMSAGKAGHVAVVTRVYWNGNVDLAQYNGNNPRGFSVAVNVRAPRYIYIPLLSPRVVLPQR